MAIQQPLGGNTLSSPDHSLSHRVFANDDAAPVMSVTVDSDGRTKAAYGYAGAVSVVTDTYNVLVTDEVVVCNKTSQFTVTLPQLPLVGQRITIKNIGTGNVVIDGFSLDTIDGAQSVTISRSDAVTLICYEANKWAII